MSGFYTQVDVHYFVDKHSVNISTTVCTALASLSISTMLVVEGSSLLCFSATSTLTLGTVLTVKMLE